MPGVSPLGILRTGLVFTLAPLCVAEQFPGDALRGRELFESRGCVQCHPGDLTRGNPRKLGRAALAAAIWNHAPAMWAQAKADGVPAPDLSTSQAEDLYSYLYVERAWRVDGRPRRAEKLLRSRRCSRCHVKDGATVRLGMESNADPISLSRIAWFHVASPGSEAVKLSPANVADLTAYLRQDAADEPIPYRPASATEGRYVFRLRGCESCHSYPPANRYPSRTPADFVAALWNHAGIGDKAMPLSQEDMRKLTGYFWSIHYFDERGDVDFGRRLFKKKSCDSCHSAESNPAPTLNSRDGALTGSRIVSSLGDHGPAMRDRMKQAEVRWPELGRTEMADLLAYLNSLKWLQTREPEPAVR